MPTNEAEAPPQRIWIQNDFSFFELNGNGTYYRTPDENSIPYVPASALAEAWEKAIKIQCQYCAEGGEPVWDDEVVYAYHDNGTVGCAASKLLAARGAALSAEKGATTSEEVGQGERNRRPFTD